MPRPHTDDLGSSCHIHVSLRDENDAPVFFDGARDRGVSDQLLNAVGGVLQHAAEFMPWYAPTINSYRRTGSQDFAGNGLTWGFDNRTTTARIIAGAASATRLEFRLPGADVNPYLALAAVLASINDGIAAGADPGPPHTGDAYANVTTSLPRTLAEAAACFAASSLAQTAFGKDVVEHYRAVADFEWDQFLTAVTDWERLRYLGPI
jgi:glutamine synthetase